MKRITWAIFVLLCACSQGKSPSPEPQAAGGGDPQVFRAPDEAVKALAAAAETEDRNAVLRLLGEESRDLLWSGDDVADRQALRNFSDALKTGHYLKRKERDEVVLYVGEQDWPFPFPLRPANNGWAFDIPAGREELLNRRIGSNELSAIGVCLGYVDAQRAYASLPRDGSKVKKFAQRFLSSPGKKDGLYWPAAADEEQSPVGRFVAEALAEGYQERQGGAYHGYLYKILTAQGRHAQGGAKNYIDARGDMTRGFALVAWPAKYGISGIMSFIVGPDGTVYRQDLGKETDEAVKKIAAFDPDARWEAESSVEE